MLTKRLPSHAPIRVQAGAAVIELAIVIVVMMMIVAGIIEFGRTFWYLDALTKATRDGARLMSTWPIATIDSAGVDAAKNLIVTTVKDANISPQLAAGNIQVECAYSSATPTFNFGSCNGSTPANTPANVRVSITGFNVTIGGWFPFVGVTGGNFGPVPLSPHTTMRYMK